MRHFKAEPLSFGTLQSRLCTVLADKHHKEVVARRGRHAGDQGLDRPELPPVAGLHPRCHDGSQPKRCDLRGTLDANRVPASYRTLIAGGWVHYFDLTYGMRHFKAEPLSFGTLQSRLWTVLADKDHKEVALDEAGMRAIKGWVDLNCPLWPNYIYRPLRPGPDAALSTTAR